MFQERGIASILQWKVVCVAEGSVGYFQISHERKFDGYD